MVEISSFSSSSQAKARADLPSSRWAFSRWNSSASAVYFISFGHLQGFVDPSFHQFDVEKISSG